MTDQPRTPDASHSYVEVVVDGVRRPGRLHGIWRRGDQHVCAVSWRAGPGVVRIETLAAEDVWVTARCSGPGALPDVVRSLDAAGERRLLAQLGIPERG